MKNSIIIKNIKNIKELKFDVPKEGVKLLTGVNGIGKTTLLTCLARIGIPTAFKDGFKSPRDGASFDSFRSSTITYSVGGQELTFRRRKKNWVAQKGKYHILGEFGFSTVVYIKADSERVQPTQKELKDKKPIDFDEDLSNIICDLLENNKFKNLQALKVDRGRGKKILLIKDRRKIGNSSRYFVRYYSEKNFSLGEICIIRLLQAIYKAPNNSLVLIDEIEMSLHPKMQINLLQYLKRISEEKNLTIIVSTHSVSMIKSVKRDDILFLHDSNNNGFVECLTPCYPAVALSNIAYEEDVDLDYIFLVEDDEAKLLLDEMLDVYWIEKGEEIKPLFRIVPIGGYPNVINFMHDNKRQLFSNNTTMLALLDKDAEFSIKDELKKKEHDNIEWVNKYKKEKNNIAFLPITPETGLVRTIEDKQHAKSIKNYLNCCNDISRIINSKMYREFSCDRKGDKKKFELIMNSLAQDAGISEKYVKRMVYKYYVRNVLAKNELFQILGPIIKK